MKEPKPKLMPCRRCGEQMLAEPEWEYSDTADDSHQYTGEFNDVCEICRAKEYKVPTDAVKLLSIYKGGLMTQAEFLTRLDEILWPEKK